jgi:hypothetical protein
MSAADVLAVRGAAVATLRAGGVRVSEHTSWPCRGASGGDFDSRGEGVADLAGARCDFTKTIPVAIPGMIATVAQHVSEEHPWLLRDEELAALDSDDARKLDARHVFIGGAHFSFHPRVKDLCFQSTGDPASHRRHTSDPLWIIEALAHVDDGDARGSDVVLGAACRRFGFHLDLERHRGERETGPRNRTVGAAHLVGDVWIDEDQRVRRVSSERIVRRRRRRGGPDHAPERRPRTVTELWDYAIQVSIPLPEVTRSKTSTPAVIMRAAGALWRRKRDYDRGHDR